VAKLKESLCNSENVDGIVLWMLLLQLFFVKLLPVACALELLLEMDLTAALA
jgi:hypothetical protein